MNLTIETKAAQSAIKALAKVVPAKPSLVIMGHLHIDAGNGVAVGPSPSVLLGRG